ncbi:hypothetical protein EVAR_55269_1 [Eumeta japonica]|uniref:Uncharacterized protein n=1 Tax=Eumeta variegata TaxID=151549 RepID=A0A4C1ZFZ1_EUMVA|nr:hypothetical protein EVAR_55269_1 [Eumeta japonica]
MSASTYLQGFSARLACDGPSGIGNTCEAFSASHFSLIFNFTNSPQSAVCEFELLSSYFIVLIAFVLRGRRSGVGLKFLPPLFYRHGGAALVGYLIQKLTTSQVRARRCSESPCIRTI